jgi:CheY-like chemotaxis protein
LVEQGFEVLEAADGADALELVTRSQADGRLRLVVIDLAMPRMGGRELAEQLLDRGYRVPLLFITGYTEDDTERLGLLGKGQEVLRKPFTPEALADRARRLVSHASLRAAKGAIPGPGPLGRSSRGRPDLTVRLRRGLRRGGHAARALPPRQQLRVVHEPVAVEPVHHLHDLEDLVRHRLELRAGADVRLAARDPAG